MNLFIATTRGRHDTESPLSHCFMFYRSLHDLPQDRLMGVWLSVCSYSLSHQDTFAQTPGVIYKPLSSCAKVETQYFLTLCQTFHANKY